MTPSELEILRDFQRQNAYQLNLLNPLANFSVFGLSGLS
jgi:hypothetical protein